MKKLMMVIAGMFVISGCATKQYPQAPSVTSEESAALDCAAIKQEIAKTHSIQNEIETTGQFDGRTVLGLWEISVSVMVWPKVKRVKGAGTSSAA